MEKKDPAQFSNIDDTTNSSDHHHDQEGAPPQPEAEVVTEQDFSYFDNLQKQPMTRADIFKFSFLVFLPTAFFIIAIVLMHHYND